MVQAKSPSENRLISVLIVEDDSTTLRALKEVIEQSRHFKGRFKVCNTALHGKTAIEMIKKQRPDIVLLDLHLPDMWGGDVAKFTLSLKKPPVIVVMSGYPTQMSLEESVKLNIYGYLTKPFKPLDVKEALEKALKFEIHFEPEVYYQMHQQLLDQKQGIEWKQPLSKREEAVFLLLCQGYTQSEMATQLEVSLNTVKTYLRRIWQKSNSPDFKTFKEKSITASKLNHSRD